MSRQRVHSVEIEYPEQRMAMATHKLFTFLPAAGSVMKAMLRNLGA